MVAGDFKQAANLVGQILASGQVAPVAATTIYTVPSSSVVKVASASITNASTTATTFDLLVVPSGQTQDSTRKVVSAYQLAPNDSIVVTELVGAMLGAGDFIVLNPSQANALNYLVTGAVSS